MEIQKSQINVHKKGQVAPYTTKSSQAEIFHHAFSIKHYQVLH